MLLLIESGSTKTETSIVEPLTKRVRGMVLRRFSMRTEKSNGEPHTKRVRWMELWSGLMNKETSSKPVYGKMEN